MGYFMLSDQVHEIFEGEWNRLNEENQEKSRIYEEIEGLRNTISEDVIKLQNAKEAKPQVNWKFIFDNCRHEFLFVFVKYLVGRGTQRA
jgi:hypothetical protein